MHLKLCTIFLFLLVAISSFGQRKEDKEIQQWMDKGKDIELTIDERQKYLKKGIALAIERKNHHWNVKGRLRLALLHFQNGDFVETVKTCHESLDVGNFDKDPLILADTYNTMGSAYAQLSQENVAVRQIRKAYHLFDRESFTPGRIQTLNNLGALHSQLEDGKSALKYLMRVEEIMRKERNTKDLASIYYNIARSYEILEDVEKAKSYLSKAKELCPPENENLRAMIAIREGEISLETEDFTLAEAAQESFDELEPESKLIRGVLIYQFTGDLAKAKEDYLKARLEYLHALKSAIELKLEDELTSIYNKLSEVEYALGNTDKALDYRRQATKHRDSMIIAQEGLNRKLSEELIAYERRQQEKIEARNHAELAKEQKESQFVLVSVVSGTLVLFLAFLFYVMRKRNRERKEKLLLEKKYQAAEEEQLANMLESQLEHLMKMAIVLSEELEFMRSFKKQLDASSVKSNSEIIELRVRVAGHMDMYNNVEGLFAKVEEVNEDFVHAVKEKYSVLTRKDIRLIGLTRLKLTNKQISNLLDTSVKNVEMAKYRLKKKLDLEKDDSLIDFVRSINLKQKGRQ